MLPFGQFWKKTFIYFYIIYSYDVPYSWISSSADANVITGRALTRNGIVSICRRTGESSRRCGRSCGSCGCRNGGGAIYNLIQWVQVAINFEKMSNSSHFCRKRCLEKHIAASKDRRLCCQGTSSKRKFKIFVWLLCGSVNYRGISSSGHANVIVWAALSRKRVVSILGASEGRQGC